MSRVSRAEQAAKALNFLAKDGYNLLGATDGTALNSFLEDYFCGEEAEEETGTSQEVYGH